MSALGLTALPLLAASLAAFFATLDANPTLYLYSALFLSDRHLTRTWSGKKVWLVGASSGIGADLAALLAGHGAELVLSGRDGDRLEKVVDRCRSRAVLVDGQGKERKERGVVGLPLDVTAPDRTLSRAVDEAIAALGGRIDVLVLNAGLGQLLPAVQTPASTTRELMEVNFHGPVRLAMRVMQRNRWGNTSHDENGNGIDLRTGHIVVTSSVLGKFPGPLSSSYSAAKHAVQGYFGTLRAECPWLRVDLPCPGPVDTPFGQRALSTVRSTKDHEDDGLVDVSSDAGPSRAKLFPDRCARLILASMTGPQSLFHETWMARQPTLGFSYISQHVPSLSNALLRRMGPLRQLVWEAGLPLYESSSFRKVAAEQRFRVPK